MENSVMAFDLKEQITKVVEKVTKDPAMLKQFDKEPVKVIEKVLGVDLPDDIVEKVVAGVKTKLATDKVSGAVDKLKGLF